MFVVKEYRKGKNTVRQSTYWTSAFLIQKGKVEVDVTDAREQKGFRKIAITFNNERTQSVFAIEGFGALF